MDELYCFNLCFKCVNDVFKAVCETSPVTTRASDGIFHCLVSSAYPPRQCDISIRTSMQCFSCSDKHGHQFQPYKSSFVEQAIKCYNLPRCKIARSRIRLSTALAIYSPVGGDSFPQVSRKSVNEYHFMIACFRNAQFAPQRNVNKLGSDGKQPPCDYTIFRSCI